MSGVGPRSYVPATRCTPSSAATARSGSMTGPGSSDMSSQSCSIEHAGVKPVVADSGSTMSSAPVAA